MFAARRLVRASGVRRGALTVGVVVAAMLGGCSASNLRYAPAQQPAAVHLYADYYELPDSVGVLIDTDGRPLESVSIRTPQGPVKPVSLQMPSAGRSASARPGTGFSDGPVGMGFRPSAPAGPSGATGLTTATFRKAAIGSAPWELHVKVRDVPEATIMVGAKQAP